LEAQEPFIPEHDEEVVEQERVRTVQLCIFRLSNIEYAVDILQVQEILKTVETTWVPTTPRFVRGVINLRGVIIPILIIQDFLNMDFEEKSKDNEYLIVRDEKLLVGIEVEKVLNIVNIPEDNVFVYEEDDPLRRENYLLGKCLVFEDEVNLLDLHRLLGDARTAL
jgi:chemotaxis signal transduction protein